MLMLKIFKILSIVFACALLFLGQAPAEVLFSDNFDSHSDWHPSPGTDDEGVSGASSACDSGDCTVQVPTGWSYYRTTGWWWPPTYNDTIGVYSQVDHTTGSGKALIVYNESNQGTSGDGWGADGQLTKQLDSGYDHIFIRFWMRLQDGWEWESVGPYGQIKVARILHYDGSGSVYLNGSSGNNGPGSIWDILQSQWGWYSLNSLRCAPIASYYSCTDGDYSNGVDFGATFDNHMGTGNWYKIVIEQKLNTYSGSAWNADGIYRMWSNDGLLLEITDKMWVEDGTDTWDWNTVGFGGNADNQWTANENYGEQWYAIDDIVIATTYQEAIDGPGDDTTPPTLDAINVQASGNTTQFDCSENMAVGADGYANFTTVVLSGGSVALSGCSITGDIIECTNSRQVAYGETFVSFAYTQPGDGLQDTATTPNNLATISTYSGSFTNNVPEPGTISILKSISTSTKGISIR